MIAYDSIDPGGETRADIRIGYAFARLASVIMASQGQRSSFKPSDFIYDFDAVNRPRQPMDRQTWESFKSMLKASKSTAAT